MTLITGKERRNVMVEITLLPSLEVQKVYNSYLNSAVLVIMINILIYSIRKLAIDTVYYPPDYSGTWTGEETHILLVLSFFFPDVLESDGKPQTKEQTFKHPQVPSFLRNYST